MPKELRISAVVTLPDDIFAEAKALVGAQPLLEKLPIEFPTAKVTYVVVTPKQRGGDDAQGGDA